MFTINCLTNNFLTFFFVVFTEFLPFLQRKQQSKHFLLNTRSSQTLKLPKYWTPLNTFLLSYIGYLGILNLKLEHSFSTIYF